MIDVTWATPLYRFLRHCNSSSLEKTVLDCGAGRRFPPLSLFRESGYESYGIELSDEVLKQASCYCKENNMRLNLLRGDIRKIPFKTSSFSFVYSHNTVFHMSKHEVSTAMQEIERVLKPNGLCFVNFMSDSIDKSVKDELGRRIGNGEFQTILDNQEVVHACYEDNEPDRYFQNFKLIHKEKRIIYDQRETKQNKVRVAYIDYIAKRK